MGPYGAQTIRPEIAADMNSSGTTGWTAMAKTVRGVDEDKVKDCKEDIDTLLVFVCVHGRPWYNI
jgi:hypothetical protein